MASFRAIEMLKSKGLINQYFQLDREAYRTTILRNITQEVQDGPLD